MANSKYSYVKTYETPDTLLPNTFIVLRIDGNSFHRFSQTHNFLKPNDSQALNLMNHAARDLMAMYNDIRLAYGQSDEFSFLICASSKLYSRRSSKILSTLMSLFTSSYVFNWTKYFPDTLLQYPPCFDGRLVLYPTEKEVMDYFAWRQVDAHVNNLYNTAFWALVQQGNCTPKEAQERLRDTVSSVKNEILFKEFGINYNQIDERSRKGSVIFATEDKRALELPDKREAEVGNKYQVQHIDIISDDFWSKHSQILQR